VLRIPRSLSPAARRHWKRLAAVLTPLGLLTPADRDAFAMLSENLALIDRGRAELSKSGLVVLIKNRPSANPYWRIVRDAEAQVLRLLVEFGQTPSARTRIFSLPSPPSPSLEQPQDIADSYFDGPEPSVQ
jgi:P27 family predicted phage terminase small subunit